jgi:hypothetical protein
MLWLQRTFYVTYLFFYCTHRFTEWVCRPYKSLFPLPSPSLDECNVMSAGCCTLCRCLYCGSWRFRTCSLTTWLTRVQKKEQTNWQENRPLPWRNKKYSGEMNKMCLTYPQKLLAFVIRFFLYVFMNLIRTVKNFLPPLCKTHIVNVACQEKYGRWCETVDVSWYGIRDWYRWLIESSAR